MSENTKIEWADSTFNGWIGCTKVGAGCDHCYAETLMDNRMKVVNWGAGNPRVLTSDANWKKPDKWNAEPFYECPDCGLRGNAKAMGDEPKTCKHFNAVQVRRRVFCSSLSDVFDNEVDPTWRANLLFLIDTTPNLDWLLLTKRIGNVKPMLEEAFKEISRVHRTMTELPKNVWLGATVVNQAEADRDIPKLLNVPAYVRFLSIEPLLGEVKLNLSHQHMQFDSITDKPSTSKIDWVIVGGESGNGARPMHPDWVRSLRDQCAAADVPYLFKQWGEYAPATAGLYYYPLLETSDFQVRANGKDCHNFGDGYGAVKIGKHKAGRLLDGVTHDGFPA